MTFLELCKRVHEQSGISGKGPTTTSGQSGVLAKLVSWVIDADMDIQALKNEWQFLWRRANATLTAGQQVYSGAALNITNLNVIDSVFVDNEQVISVPWQDWLGDFDQRNQDLGWPRILSVDPTGNIYLYPVPESDMAIKVNYYTEPTALSNDSDVSLIPAKYHDCIVQKALMYYATFEEDMQLYQMASARYETRLTDLCNSQLPIMGFDIRGLI